jgi:hypothetical protein
MGLKLPSGVCIPECQRKLSTFAEQEYELYNGVAVPMDSTLTIHDILLSVMVNSRLDGGRAASVWQNRARMEQALAVIPASASLLDAEQEIPWEALERLFDAARVRGAGLAVASKILHKKRPALIPMLDNVVLGYYRSSYPHGWKGLGPGGTAVKAMKHLREDLLAVKPEIDTLCSRLAENGWRMTQVRALEALVWMQLEPRGYYREGIPHKGEPHHDDP